MIGMYTNISNETFNQMLLKAFNGNLEKFNHLINENDKITFIRHYTDLIDRYSYIKLQKSQWNWYYHIGITQNIWTIHIPKHIAEKNSIWYTYGRSKHMIEQRRKQIQQQLSEIEKLFKFLNKKYYQDFHNIWIIHLKQNGDRGEVFRSSPWGSTDVSQNSMESCRKISFWNITRSHF